TLKLNYLARPERPKNPTDLYHAFPQFLVFRPHTRRGILIESLARSNTQICSPWRETRKRRCRLRNDRRMVAQYRTGHTRPHLHAAQMRRHGPQPRPRKARLPLFTPRMKVVAYIQALKTRLFSDNSIFK